MTTDLPYGLLEKVDAQVRSLRRDGRQPREVRLGKLDYSELMTAKDVYRVINLFGGSGGQPILMGLPVRRIGLERCVSVV